MSIRKRTIEEITETLIDYRGKTPPKTVKGVKLITAKVIKNGFIVEGEHEYIANDYYDSWMRRGLPHKGDILITTEAPLGEVARIQSAERIALAQRVILLRGNPKLVDQAYYFYALQSNFVQGELQARATGTTVLGIKQSELRQVMIPTPPLSIQRKIGDILSAYDDLLANNKRRIRILEEMAQNLYREWFVEFRFPGHEKVRMVDSALGLVPEGWEVRELGEIADVNVRNISRGQEPEAINYVDISSVSTGRIDAILPVAFSEAPGRARRIVKHGDIIWAMVRPNRRSYALVLHPIPDLIVSTGFAVITSRDVPYTYLYKALTTDDFADYLTNNATGSAYPAVNAGDFGKAKVLVPSSDVLEKFHRFTVEVYEEKENLLQKNVLLRQTRDLLLPKLISGEMSVNSLSNEVACSSICGS